MEKQKKIRQQSTLVKFLKEHNAKEHFMVYVKESYTSQLVFIIARDNKLIEYRKRMGFGGDWGGLTYEEAKEILDFINQE